MTFFGLESGSGGRLPGYLSVTTTSNESHPKLSSTGPLALAATSSMAVSTTERTRLTSSAEIFHSLACFSKKTSNDGGRLGTRPEPQITVMPHPEQEDGVEGHSNDHRH